MIASAQTIAARRPLSPLRAAYRANGYSGGLGPAGYDIALDKTVVLGAGCFMLGASVECFDMPLDMLGIVHDKSTWARQGVAVQNTVVEPGWRGYLTIELTNHSEKLIMIKEGTPIAQVVFHMLDQPTSLPYIGKYQDQPAGAQPARLDEPKANSGHGHVFPRPDGIKARCGGPGICPECSLEAGQYR